MNKHNLFASVLLLGLIPELGARASDLPERRAVAIFGQRIEYYDVGSGPVIVLLHGLGSSAKGDWGACIVRLSAHHRVLAPDMLGFGASDKPIIDYGIQTWVDFLGEFLRVEQVKEFTLAGESLGGWVAAQYSVQALSGQPLVSASFTLPKPSRLILVDAAGHKHQAEGTGTGAPGISLGGSKALLSAIFFDPSRSSDEAVRAQFAMSMAKGDGWTIHSLFTNRFLVAESIDDKLDKITIPTLVLWGDHDRLVPLDDGKDYAKRIAGAKLVVIPESGHAPGIEKPELVLAAIEPFIDGP